MNTPQEVESRPTRQSPSGSSCQNLNQMFRTVRLEGIGLLLLLVSLRSLVEFFDFLSTAFQTQKPFLYCNIHIYSSNI